ncbi:MAG: hypothetical protein ACOX3T_01165 [Bdellovibrionota bacterium]
MEPFQKVITFLRLLFSKAGVEHCPKHNEQKIGAYSVNDFISNIKKYKNERIKILSPVINQKKGTHIWSSRKCDKFRVCR